jgi:hypothetical protein
MIMNPSTLHPYPQEAALKSITLPTKTSCWEDKINTEARKRRAPNMPRRQRTIEDIHNVASKAMLSVQSLTLVEKSRLHGRSTNKKIGLSKENQNKFTSQQINNTVSSQATSPATARRTLRRVIL